MLQRNGPYFFLPVPFMLAVGGLAFCAWNMLSAETVPCVSSGCQLFRDFTIGGFSLWWAGVAGFGALALVALAGRPSLGRLFAGTGVLLDCFLLLILLMSSPCLPCLITGLLLALCYLAFLFSGQKPRPGARRSFSVLLLVWSLIFVANVGCLFRDALDPWPMLEARAVDYPVKAYVSPSCPACRQLMLGISPDRAERISWFPVAEGERDVRVIAALVPLLQSGEPLSVALPKALENPVPESWDLLRPEMIALQLRLWRNQADVMARGGVLPQVEFPGLPAFLLPQTASSPAPVLDTDGPARAAEPASDLGPNPFGGLPFDMDIAGQCNPLDDAEPCDDPEDIPGLF